LTSDIVQESHLCLVQTSSKMLVKEHIELLSIQMLHCSGIVFE